MQRRNFLQLAALGALYSWATPAGAVEKVPPDPAGQKLCSELLAALQIEDSAQRLSAVLPLVHKSMKTRDGKDLDRNTKDFSYKKASGAAKLYSSPAEITEVHKGNVSTIGFKESAETGRTDKYFLAKKPGVNGRPAPIHVFFPEGGGEPKIVNFGSL